MFHQVNFEEHPTPANLGAGDFTGARLVLERDRMDMQKFCGLLEIEGLHGSSQKLLIQKPGIGAPNSNLRITPLVAMLFMICVQRW